MPPLQAVALIEVQQLLAEYAYAIDAREFDRLDAVFTTDAVIDYSATGGIRGSLAAIKPWLAEALRDFPLSQHLLGLPLIRLEADRGTARTMLFNPMLHAAAGGERLFFVGATYIDDLVRTVQGWRISHRRQAAAWFNDPPQPRPVP